MMSMFVVWQDVYTRSTKSNDKNVEHNDKEHDAHYDEIEATANLKPKLKISIIFSYDYFF